MHFAEIDRLANGTYSSIHSARVLSKFIFTVFMISAFIISNRVEFTLALLGVILFLFWLGAVPFKTVANLALYPLFFSSIFALMELRSSTIGALMIIIRAVGAALTLVLLITTTPYTDLFSFLSLWLPKILIDTFMFTYRSVFILLDRLSNLMKSMKLRGGYSSFNIFKNMKNIAGALGVLIITSFDMSERMHKIYSLRGYKEGGIRSEIELFPLRGGDYLLFLLGFSSLLGGFIL